MSIGALQNEADLERFIRSRITDSMNVKLRQVQGKALQAGSSPAPVDPVIARLGKSSPQLITYNTDTPVTWQELEDEPNGDQFSAGNPGRLTCQDDGLYLVNLTIGWTLAANYNGAAILTTKLNKNGATLTRIGPEYRTSVSTAGEAFSLLTRLSVTDILEVQVSHNIDSGTAHVMNESYLSWVKWSD